MYLLLALTMMLSAQHHEWKVDLPKVPLELHGILEIECSNFKAGDSINIAVAREGEPALIGAFIVPGEGSLMFPTVKPVPLSWLEVGAGKTKVTRLSQDEKNLLVFGRVPPGTQISLSVDGKTAIAGILKNSILYRGGQIASGSERLNGAVVKALHGDFQPRVVRLADNHYFVPFSLLKPLSVEPTLPDIEIRTNRPFSFFLTINEDGTVVDVKFPQNTSPDIVSLVGSAVRQWRFRPYLVDGRPVRVSTVGFARG